VLTYQKVRKFACKNCCKFSQIFQKHLVEIPVAYSRKVSIFIAQKRFFFEKCCFEGPLWDTGNREDTKFRYFWRNIAIIRQNFVFVVYLNRPTMFIILKLSEICEISLNFNIINIIALFMYSVHYKDEMLAKYNNISSKSAKFCNYWSSNIQLLIGANMVQATDSLKKKF
jgi:hypothetical protein